MKLYQFKKDRNLLAVSLDDKQSMLSQNLASVNAKLTELRIRHPRAGREAQDDRARARQHRRGGDAARDSREARRSAKLRESYIQLSKEYARAVVASTGPSTRR